MVHLVYEQRRPSTTARTYAMHLQKFLKHIAALGIPWTDVTDGVLIAWREALLERQALTSATIRDYLSTVFAFS